MAIKKGAKKGTKKIAPKRVAPARGRAKALKARVPTRKTSARRTTRSAPNQPPQIRHGTVTHTEIASSDPPATKSWLETVLGWKFVDPMPTPAGPYHMWRFDIGTGGGLRAVNPPEMPGSIPYCEVDNIKEAFSKAVAAGATAMMPPEEIPGSNGWIAIVQAPGGVPIGFWGRS